MGRIISAYFKGFAQLSDPKTRSVVWASIGWSVAILISLYIAIHIVLKLTTFITIGFLETSFDLIAQVGVMALTWYLFPAVVTSIGSLMLDKVVDAVESRHYPHLPMAAGLSLADGIIPALKFLGVTVGYNLLITPLFIFPPAWPLIPFVYLALNGYLISREYFELVAFRRIEMHEARSMRARWKLPLFVAGVGFAVMLTVPVLNIIAPVIATAAMVHLFESWRAKDGLKDKPSGTTKKMTLNAKSTDIAES
jgi:uncharacterized protein involved in cysteine biosynthesis